VVHLTKEELIYRDRAILITGGTGSIGIELAKAALRYRPRQVVLFTNDENGLFEAMSMFRRDPAVVYRLGDVRDRRSVDSAVVECDMVFHAAALKHVDFCEENPNEAISTNVIGTQNVINSAIENEVSRFVYISTDKAVNPVSVMGATKLLGEKLTLDANKMTKKTIFSCVRFGNVFGSRGSVVRIFESQIRNKEFLTVHEPEMTRFIMLPGEAARMVLHAGARARPGETIVLKMEAVKIGDFAEACKQFFARRYDMRPDGIRIRSVGAGPGEKTHEELMTEAEALRAIDGGAFYIIPSLSEASVVRRSRAGTVRRSSNSAPLFSRIKIDSLLSSCYPTAIQSS
jgi:UDP-N-acetylglucosamine 4,6-dehydratase